MSEVCAKESQNKVKKLKKGKLKQQKYKCVHGCYARRTNEQYNNTSRDLYLWYSMSGQGQITTSNRHYRSKSGEERNLDRGLRILDPNSGLGCVHDSVKYRDLSKHLSLPLTTWPSYPILSFLIPSYPILSFLIQLQWYCNWGLVSFYGRTKDTNRTPQCSLRILHRTAGSTARMALSRPTLLSHLCGILRVIGSSTATHKPWNKILNNEVRIVRRSIKVFQNLRRKK